MLTEPPVRQPQPTNFGEGDCGNRYIIDDIRHGSQPPNGSWMSDMERKTFVFIALAITIFYGVLAGVLQNGAFSAIGAAVVALSWIAVGVFGNNGRNRDGRRERPDLRRD